MRTEGNTMGALEKIAYLKGLLDGLEVADETQKKVYAAIAESLDALALELTDNLDRIEELGEMYEELSDDYSQLDEDLEALEEDFALFMGEEYEDEPEFDETYESVVCPACSHVFYYEPEAYEEGEKLQCPACGEEFPKPEE